MVNNTYVGISTSDVLNSSDMFAAVTTSVSNPLVAKASTASNYDTQIDVREYM